MEAAGVGVDWGGGEAAVLGVVVPATTVGAVGVGAGVVVVVVVGCGESVGSVVVDVAIDTDGHRVERKEKKKKGKKSVGKK